MIKFCGFFFYRIQVVPKEFFNMICIWYFTNVFVNVGLQSRNCGTVIISNNCFDTDWRTLIYIIDHLCYHVTFHTLCTSLPVDTAIMRRRRCVGVKGKGTEMAWFRPNGIVNNLSSLGPNHGGMPQYDNINAFYREMKINVDLHYPSVIWHIWKTTTMLSLLKTEILTHKYLTLNVFWAE